MPVPAAPGRIGGAGYGELLVTTALILILTYLVITRIWPLRIAAERVGMEHRLATLRSALGIEMVTRARHGGTARLAALAGTNPMALLDTPPANYLGELDAPDPAAIDGYTWYFDRRQRVLVYRVANADHFETALPGPARARFELRLRYRDRDGDRQYNPAVDSLTALRLEALEPYRWRDGPQTSANADKPLQLSKATP